MDSEQNQTITALENEIASLKEQLQISREKENLNQLTLTKIKQIHKEYETSYLTAISEYKAREEQLKNQYFTYQSLLEEQFNQSEQRLNEQITQLKSVVKSKTNLITQLTKQNSELKQIITKNEIDFNLKEHEYENMLSIKDKTPQYILFGVDRGGSNFWGEPTTFLGWYANEEMISKEIEEIHKAILQGIPTYTLQYSAKTQRRWASVRIVEK